MSTANQSLNLLLSFPMKVRGGPLITHISDVFSVLAVQWSQKQPTGNANWLIGEGVFSSKIKGVALRSMKAPGTAYDDAALGGKDPQVAHMKDYVKGSTD